MSVATHEAKKRRTTQVLSCSFPCGKWLHIIGARASSLFVCCGLCRREKHTYHYQKKLWRTIKARYVQRVSVCLSVCLSVCHCMCVCLSVCLKARDVQRKGRASLEHTICAASTYLLFAMTKHVKAKAKRVFEFIWEDTERQLLWKESCCGGKRESQMSYHGKTLQMRRKDCWL